jgi:hypothetical protein
MIVSMPNDNRFTLRQVDQARGDLYAIADDLEFLKLELARLPSRAYVSRLALMATATVCSVIGFVALLLAG